MGSVLKLLIMLYSSIFPFIEGDVYVLNFLNFSKASAVCSMVLQKLNTPYSYNTLALLEYCIRGILCNR